MTKDSNISEPSMDEILASIRQIISTDIPEVKNEGGGEPDILDLTQLLPEENQHLKSMNSHISPTHQDDQVLSLKDPLDDSFISAKTINETVEAFDSLSKLAHENSPSPLPRVSREIGGQTIESLIRDMLKPLLKEWLDAQLPKIVQALVREQLEKIVERVDVSHSQHYSQRENY